MTLTLDGLLWVLPGVCFLFVYHRLRDVESLELSNWSYVFFIVFIGVITILPLQYFFDEEQGSPISFKVLCISTIIGFLLPFVIRYVFNPFVERLEQDPNFFIPSFFWSLIYFFFPLENRDKFIKNCIDYEGEAVLVIVDESVVLEKDKSLSAQSTVFLGILVEFPYVSTSSIDTHAIRILPLLKGYNRIEKGKEKIEWIQKYIPNKESEGIIIPRSKIIHFCAYDEEQHDNIIRNKSGR